MATSCAASKAAGATGSTPWTLTVEGRWFGRGSADNKGQHSINLAALAAVLAARGGKLGFNVSGWSRWARKPVRLGWREFCDAHQQELAADVLIACDGPRLARRPAHRVSRHARRGQFRSVADLRDGGHHSGNWGGLLRNPATVLAHALASSSTRAAHRGRRPAPAADSRSRCGERWPTSRSAAARATRRSMRLGRARSDAGRAGVRLEHVRGAGLKAGNAGAAGQRHSARGACALPIAFRGRHRFGEIIPASLRRHLDRHGFPLVEIRRERGAPADGLIRTIRG